MMIMPANNASGIVHYLAGKCPGNVGWCMSPDGWRKPPFYMPYGLDNGAFINFDPHAFYGMLQKAKKVHLPLWAACPDVVGDAEATMKMWHIWHNFITFPLAFVCQDGMEPQDVPEEAFCCFIGGTTKWKLENAHRFKGVRPWLHIGRVNTHKRLTWAREIGADSVDGTGFFRGSKEQLAAFITHCCVT